MRQGEKIKKKLSDPNVLTLIRIGTVPIIILLLMSPNRLTSFLAGIVFSVGAITDYFDGMLARQRGLVSNFGKVLDPVADKLLVSSSLVMLTSLGWIPAWMVCIIIGRELAVTGLRSIVAHSNQDVSASKLGKYKTGFQIAAIIPLMFHYSYIGLSFHDIGMFFLWASLVLTVWSGAAYFFQYRKLLQF